MKRRGIATWLLLLLAAWLPHAGAVELVRGPEVTATATNALIRWTLDTPAGGRVRLGDRPNRLDRRTDADRVAAQHEVRVDGLKPGTTYHFTVGTARVTLATNSFSTPGQGLPAPPTAPAPGPAPAAAPPLRDMWGSPASLPDHFDRHGGDFGAKSPEDYARQAWEFLQRGRREGLSAKLDAGVLRVYDPRTGGFGAYNRDGTARTYFKPSRRQAYFDDQPGRTVDLRRWEPERRR